MSRKAVVISEIVVYILSIVVISAILLYGYSAIRSLNRDVEKATLIEFEKDLNNEVTKLLGDYGSVSVFDSDNPLIVPQKYRFVCFVDKSFAGTVTITTNMLPLLNDNIKDTDDNVFIILDDLEHAFDINKLSVSGGMNKGYLCVKVINGRIDIMLEGFGNSVIVTEYTGK